MIKHLKYFSYVFRHKFWVGYYCFKEGLIWRGLKHDWSKFLPGEWLAYANYFYGEGSEERMEKKKKDKAYKPYNTGDQKFDLYWLSHQHRNDHHWQFWVIPEDDGGLFVLPMKTNAIIEMICDWRGAGRAQGFKDNTPDWYAKNKQNQRMHHLTRLALESHLIKIYGQEAMEKAATFVDNDGNYDKEPI